MGKPFRVEAVLNENARTYFLERDSAAFRALLSKVLKLGTVEMTDIWKDGESTFVRLVTRPDFGNWVPKGVQGQANAKAIEFHDVIEYNPALIQQPPFQVNVKTESPFLGDKLDVRLALIIEEIDENTCRQVLTGTIKVNMFGVGRIVESIVKESLHNTYKKLPEIVRRWQAFRAEALANGNAKELISGRPPVGQSISWIRAEVLAVMQSPIEAEAVLPPASPTAVVSPDDLSQFSTDEAGAAAGPAPGAAAAAAAAAAGPFAGPAGSKGPGAAAGAEGEMEAAPSPSGPSTAQQSPEVSAISGLRSCATEYYDAVDSLEDDAASSAPRPADGAGAGAGGEESDRSTGGRLQRRRRLQEQQALPLEVPQPIEESPPRHRRNVSSESADSGGDIALYGGDPHSPFQKRPNSQRSWRRFNNQYEEWTSYWDLMGVKHMAPREPPSGPLGILYKAQGLVREGASTLLVTAYLFALRKGLISVTPNEDGRSAGRAPRLELRPSSPVHSGAGAGPYAGATGSGLSQPLPLHRQLSAPVVGSSAAAGTAVQQAQQQGAGAGAEVFMSLPAAGGDSKAGLLGQERDHFASPCPYGNTDEAAALVARTTQRRLSAGGGARGGGHRRAVSVDTGTAAAAASARGLQASAASSRLGPGRGGSGSGEPGARQAGAGPQKRRSTTGALVTSSKQLLVEEEEDGRVAPRYSCLPVCWRRRHKQLAPVPERGRAQ